MQKRWISNRYWLNKLLEWKGPFQGWNTKLNNRLRHLLLPTNLQVGLANLLVNKTQISQGATGPYDKLTTVNHGRIAQQGSFLLRECSNLEYVRVYTTNTIQLIIEPIVVIAKAGLIELTLILYFAQSTAKALVNPSTPALLAQ